MSETTCIRVRPSREGLNPDDIVRNFAALHSAGPDREGDGDLTEKLNPLKGEAEEPPKFVFWALSRGEDEPVEFLYSVDDDYLDILESRLKTAYPATFEIDRQEVDLVEKIVPPARFSDNEFVGALREDRLLVSDADDEHSSSPDEADGDGATEDERYGLDAAIDIENTDRVTNPHDDFELSDGPQVTNQSPAEAEAERRDRLLNTGEDVDEELLDTDPSDRPTGPDGEPLARTGSDMSASGEGVQLEDVSDAVGAPGDETHRLREFEADLIQEIDKLGELDPNRPVTAIDGPRRAPNGDIIARPSLEDSHPVVTEWEGVGERKRDWMTTIKMFSDIAEPEADDIQSRAPLAMLIQQLAESTRPIAFQVVFRKMPNWTDRAQKRKTNLHLNRDTTLQKVRYELGEIVHGPSRERRREKRRDYFEESGETSAGSDSAVAGEVGSRGRLIDNKVPKNTFQANIRAVSLATTEEEVPSVVQKMNNISSVLDGLDGYFYNIEANLTTDTEDENNNNRLSSLLGGGETDHNDGSDSPAVRKLHEMLNADLKSGTGKRRPDLVLNADELANFLGVPSSKNLTVEGTRGTRAEAESRSPLPRPNPSLMQHFHGDGMHLGYALDEDEDMESIPTTLPPDLQTTHYGRFATTGAGKSKSLINDTLSLFEHTDGPTILIDPKGDGMLENYLRCHYAKFGAESLREDVIYFPIPEVMPGFSFFNIDQQLSDGKRRAAAQQDVADYYEELLKLVMGAERYRESKVAPNLIKGLIKSQFSETEGERRNPEDPEPNVFSHQDLEEAADQLKKAAEQEDKSLVPQTADERIRKTMTRHIDSDNREFGTIMDAVYNRLDYIRSDKFLQPIFDNTEPQFSFSDHLNDDKVILFDLGDLRDDSTVIMAGLILTNLWDSLQRHSRTKCTHGHENVDECRVYAREQANEGPGSAGISVDERVPERLPCREAWDDDHVVNMIIDEAATVAVSDIMNKMLEQGRSFHLSLGLSMQYPEQMKDAGDRAYKNVLQNIGTLCLGKIKLEDDIAQAMAHENMDVQEFANRMRALPRGEWVVQLPSPEFKETGPEPFSVSPLPIPPGHPESTQPLSDDGEDLFQHYLQNEVLEQSSDMYGVVEEDDGPDLTAGAKTTPDADEEAAADTTTPSDAQAGASESEPADAHADTDKRRGDGQDTSAAQESQAQGAESTTYGADSGGDSDGELKTTAPSASRDLFDTPDEDGVIRATGTDPDASDHYYGTDSGAATEVGVGTDSLGADSWAAADPDLPFEVRALLVEQDTDLWLCPFCDEEWPLQQRVRGCLKHAHTGAIPEGNLPPELREDAQIRDQMQESSDSDDLVYYSPTRDADDLNRDVLDRIGPSADTLLDDTGVDDGTGDATPAGPAPVIEGIEDLERLPAHPAIESSWSEDLVDRAGGTFLDISWPDDGSLCETYLGGLVGVAEDEVGGSVTTLSLQASASEATPLEFGVKIGDTVHYPDTVESTARVEAVNGELPEAVGVDADEATWKSANGGTTDPDADDEAGTGVEAAADGGGGAATSSRAGRDSLTLPEGTSKPMHGNPQKLQAPKPREHPYWSSTHDISKEQADFLFTLANAAADNLHGYDLTDSMRVIKENAGPRGRGFELDSDAIQQLEEKGYLRKHSFVGKRSIYYTVTSEGREVVGANKFAPLVGGDTGEETPHRVGVELLRRVIASRGDVTAVEKYVPLSGISNAVDEEACPEGYNVPDNASLDVVGYNNGEVVVVGEVESARSRKEAEKQGLDDTRVGLKDYESVRKDYALMEAFPKAESVWAFRNRDIAHTALRALSSLDGGCVDEEMAELWEEQRPEIEPFSENTLPDDTQYGMNRLETFISLRDAVSESG